MSVFYLNSDNSLIGEITDSGRLLISSNHSNLRNSQRLVSNISAISSLESKGNKYTVSLNGTPYVSVSKKDDTVSTINSLTSFETRLFARGKGTEALPFQRFEKQLPKLSTDLHTHFAGALPPAKLIECGIGRNIKFPKYLLDKAGIQYSFYQPDESGMYALEDIISNSQNKQLLVNSMKIDTSEQETFNKMEDIYAMRGPLTKNKDMFIPILRAIAEDSKQSGVDYLELSLSSIISDVNQLRLLDEFMPTIERETGVQIRFLGAMWRHSDKEWNQDEVDRLQIMAQSPYVVGCDFMGHETNSTREFYSNIKDLAKYAIKNDPNFVIRVHAGENPLFKANARDVLLAVEEAHFELSQGTKKDLPFPQVRLGHGIYGFNEPAPWDEAERTRDMSMLDLCKMIKPVVEFNMSSNLSLNNINSLNEIPIKSYIDAGVQVVLGTDGRGIYSTDLGQEMILAYEAGLTVDDFKKIAKTEKTIKDRARTRFSQHKKCDLDIVEEGLAICYRDGSPCYTAAVEEKYKLEKIEVQKSLSRLIGHSGAETDLSEIESAISGKMPIMITGSSHKHWPNISPENVERIQVALEVLTNCIDPEKAYLVTGGTNHGVEREAHISANSYNRENPNNQLVVLGTLTEEAIQTDTNNIEANTITHAMIPTLNGKPAGRWFDLPDTVLQHLADNDGMLVAIAGGSIVSDIIQRSHNMGLNMKIMSNVEGASGEKAESLYGNDYGFLDARELVEGLIESNPEILRPEVLEGDLDQIIADSYKKVCMRSSAEETTSESLDSTQATATEIKPVKVEKPIIIETEIEQ
ncbi:MAG: hypothetical protein IKI95_08350 [Clostridia bacterium]|nr:hypothetical protein [Clostridia bacterium]